MSSEQSNSFRDTDVTVNSPISVITSTQTIGTQLSDIPMFSLGPSVYDYVSTFEDSTSSIGSSSPPGTPPEDPIPIDQHLYGSALIIAQEPNPTTGPEQNQHGSSASNPGQTSSSHISHSSHSSTAAHIFLSVKRESSHVPPVSSIKIAVQDSIEASPMNKNIFAKDILRNSTTVCTSESSSNKSQSVDTAIHKCNKQEIKTDKNPSLYPPDKGNPAEHGLKTDGTHEKTQDF